MNQSTLAPRMLAERGDGVAGIIQGRHIGGAVFRAPGRFRFAPGLLEARIQPRGSRAGLRSELKRDIQAAHAHKVVRQRMPAQHTAGFELASPEERVRALPARLRVRAFDGGGPLRVPASCITTAAAPLRSR